MRSSRSASAVSIPAQRARPVGELATVATFARDHAISVSTVRAMIRDGRLSAVKIGRAVRVRRDAQIGEPALGADVPAARARRILGGDLAERSAVVSGSRVAVVDELAALHVGHVAHVAQEHDTRRWRWRSTSTCSPRWSPSR